MRAVRKSKQRRREVWRTSVHGCPRRKNRLCLSRFNGHITCISFSPRNGPAIFCSSLRNSKGNLICLRKQWNEGYSTSFDHRLESVSCLYKNIIAGLHKESGRLEERR